MNADPTGGTLYRAEPLERVARTFHGWGDRGWDPPQAPGITVERLLGAEADALVWLVWWDSPAEPDWQLVDGCPPAAFALKVPRAPVADPIPLRSAIAELQALDMLRHEHLVRAYGVLETSRGLGLMLEPYSAGALGDLLLSVGTLDLGEVVTVLTPIATALGALHRGGVAHGKVTPGNILLAADGKPALGDLADAAVLGTPRTLAAPAGFTAPERDLEARLPPEADAAARREARAGLAPAADVYALGAVAWFALTHSVPAVGRRRAPLRSLRPELPASISRLLEAALDTEPARRPSAEDFAVELFRCAAPTALDLTPYVHEEVVPELPSRPGPAKQGHRRAPRFAALTLAGLGFAGLWVAAGPPVAMPTTTLVPASQEAHPESQSRETSGAPDTADTPETADTPDTPGPSEAGAGRAETPEPRFGTGDGGGSTPLQLLRDPDPMRAVAGIAALRTQALREVSEQDVRRYTVPDAPARSAELELIRGFARTGAGYQGAALSIQVSREDANSSSGSQQPESQQPESSDPDLAPERVTELPVTVTAGGGSAGAAESQRVLLVLHRVQDRWLLHSVLELPASVEDPQLQ